jgi:hypothetical protein
MSAAGASSFCSRSRWTLWVTTIVSYPSFGRQNLTVAIAFIAVESRAASPMLPLSFFRNRTFTAANVVAALMFFAMIGTVFFLALYLQNVQGYAPTQAGLRLLPFSATISSKGKTGAFSHDSGFAVDPSPSELVLTH